MRVKLILQFGLSSTMVRRLWGMTALLAVVCTLPLPPNPVVAQERVVAVAATPEDPESSFSRRVNMALNKRVSVQFEAETLDDVVLWLTEETGLPFETDVNAFDDEGIDVHDTVVTVHAEDISFRTFLRLLALRTESHPQWTVERECVCLAPQSADEKFVHATFDVTALLHATQEFEDARKKLWEEPRGLGFGGGMGTSAGGLGSGGFSGTGSGVFSVAAEKNTVSSGRPHSLPAINSAAQVFPQFGGGSFGSPPGQAGGSVGQSGFVPMSADIDDLLQAHTSGNWLDDAGTGGTMDLVGNVLSVRASQQQIEQVRQLLDMFHRAVKSKPAEQVFRMADETSNATAIHQILNKTRALEFSELTVEQVLELIAKQFKFNLIVDALALEDAGIELDDIDAVLSARTVSLRSALASILEPHELTYEICDNCLLITSVEKAEQGPHRTVVYDLREMLNKGLDERRLIDAVQLTGHAWEDVDGEGGSISLGLGGFLIVSNTTATLEHVTRTLQKIRGTFQSAVLRNTPEERRLVTQFYDVPAGADAAKFLKTVSEFIEPETWSASSP